MRKFTELSKIVNQHDATSALALFPKLTCRGQHVLVFDPAKNRSSNLETEDTDFPGLFLQLCELAKDALAAPDLDSQKHCESTRRFMQLARNLEASIGASIKSK